MNFIWDKITEWLKGLLVGGIVSNLSGLFDSINTRVADVASTVGKTPQAWNGSIFIMIKSLSENVVVHIAGIILTFVMCLELIQLLIDRNNMHDFETFIFFKWIFKTFAAVLIVTNTWNIVMGVFDVAQHAAHEGLILERTIQRFLARPRFRFGLRDIPALDRAGEAFERLSNNAPFVEFVRDVQLKAHCLFDRGHNLSAPISGHLPRSTGRAIFVAAVRGVRRDVQRSLNPRPA